MIYKNKMPINILLILCFMHLNCTETKADESLIYIKVPLSERYIHYNEVNSKYGDIYIGYSSIPNSNITIMPGYDRFIIEKAYCYYMKEGSYILLGSIGKLGVYDKNGSCIKEVDRIASGFKVVGISSAILGISGILVPRLILQSETDSNYWRETEAFVFLDFDTEQDTLRLMDMSQLYR